MWRRRKARALGAELTADAEAFLTGRYAERLEAQDRVVPVWAWTNLLAHGSAASLRLEAVGAAFPAEPRTWRSARAVLASEVLDAAPSEETLGEVQAAVLAPLELKLSMRSDATRWGQRTWTEAVRAALRSHRASRQA